MDLERIAVVCLTIVALAGIGAGFKYCSDTDERRLQCVKMGRSPEECKKMLDAGDAK